MPVLFIVFKRHYTAIKVFERLRQIKPKKLYVAADGPRSKEEAAMCEQTRSIVKLIDWECDVHLRFRDKNLGCKYAPYDSITWFLNTRKKV